MRGLSTLFIGAFICALFTACGPSLPEEVELAYEDLPELIDFNFHVKPILSDRCYACHGPDKNTRKAGLRLDLEENAFAALTSGKHAFVKGDLGKSESIIRMLSEDPEVQMPPPESKLSLDPKEIATIVKWVEQGAEWKPHWSFIIPEKPDVPEDFPSEWEINNEIDAFIYEKQGASGLSPSKKANKERLIRRVTMDLTGLPPAIKEIDDFLADESSNAYEKVVDRLLASDAYAERLTMEWLDVSRYADSHGLHADGYRYMWPWRDWVIKAFKENLSYDQFVTWQLAGDLLPNPTKEQRLATAFHRNHPMTAEGGAIDEEFRLEYVADRTNTTATAFLGLTMECARCHDHKFDPISQKEYYSMSAFFNNIKDLGMTGDDGNYGPMLMMTDEKDDEKISEIRKMIHSHLQRSFELQEGVSVSNAIAVPDVNRISGLVGLVKFDDYIKGEKGKFYIDGDKRIITSKEPVLVPAQVKTGGRITGEYDEVLLIDRGIFETYDAFSSGAWINTSKRNSEKTQTIIGNTGNKNNFWRGWDFVLDSLNRLTVRLIHSLPHNYIQVTTVDSVHVNQGTHVFFTYDGSMSAEGIKIYLNGNKTPTFTEFDQLYKSIKPINNGSHELENRPLKIGSSNRSFTGENGLFKGLMDEIRLYERELTPLEVFVVSRQDIEPDEHLLLQHAQLTHSGVKKEKEEVREAVKKFIEYTEPINEVMVMKEMDEPRMTHLLQRGQYNAKGEVVLPATPESVLSFPDELEQNRLGLAKWLFADENPLTARVAVNRYWQMIFGKGIVRTSNDFGSQGALPSHPELLDWLAVTFKESGWDVKRLLRMMVMSATYQQSSIMKDTLMKVDPQNILLARSPSYRWSAETIRDNALAASGLLVEKVGGKSVKPYQPDSLWIELGNFSHILLYFHQDHGDDLYRRSMYTFIRRTSPPPYMTTFDMANRDVCTVKREITNTPLQALNLMNDPQFIEAARVLAERAATEPGKDIGGKIAHAFRLVTSRLPDDEELDVLVNLYQREEKKYANNPDDAKALLSVGEYKSNKEIPSSRLAALTMVANTMLNLDETYTKR